MSEPWYGMPRPEDDVIIEMAREATARVRDRLGVLDATRAFMLDAVEHPSFCAGSPEQGARWLLYAWRGRCMREHFEQQHPQCIELGLDGAPAGGVEREGWLWGYRWQPKGVEA